MKDTTECLLEWDHFERVSNQSAHSLRTWIEMQKLKCGYIRICAKKGSPTTCTGCYKFLDNVTYVSNFYDVLICFRISISNSDQ